MMETLCEVQALCSYGNPNWLGWVVLIGVPMYLVCKFLATVAIHNEWSETRGRTSYCGNEIKDEIAKQTGQLKYELETTRQELRALRGVFD